MNVPLPAETVTILLVEDNPADAELTQEGLKRAKVLTNLHVVEDGEQALAFLRHEAPYADAPFPDLIFLDLNLPKMDGREVLAEIKSDPRLEHIPVVVLTSSDADADVLKAYKLKASCYVKKPVMFKEFIETIKAVDEFWLTVVKLPPQGS